MRLADLLPAPSQGDVYVAMQLLPGTDQRTVAVGGDDKVEQGHTDSKSRIASSCLRNLLHLVLSPVFDALGCNAMQ